MTHAQMASAGRWAVILMGTAVLAACATPHYAVTSAGPGGGHSAYAGGAGGQASRPPANPGAHGTMAPYQVGGIWYVPREQPGYNETGVASWYGDAFNLKATANGEVFDMNAVSAAHTTLPLPCMVEVTNLDNGSKLTVRVNDRGPFVGGRIIDLSYGAAQQLGYDRAGTAHVRVRYLGPAPLAGPDAGVRYAKATPNSASPAYPAVRAPVITQVSTPVRGPNARPADEEIFAEVDPAGAPPPAPKPLVAPPAPVSVSALAPLPAAQPRAAAFHSDGFHDVDAPTAPSAFPAQSSFSSPAQSTFPPAVIAGSAYRIQTGVYGDESNARRAVAELARFGTAVIEPFERSGQTLYRVTLPGPSDEAEAYGVRDRVAAVGFADARVLQPKSPAGLP